MPDRPLSPHLSVYKFKYTLLSSILNRLTGLGLTAGLLVLAYWLTAASRGHEVYARATAILSHGLFKLVFAAFLFAFSYHFLAGLRHLVWDTGHGLERRQSQKSAWLVGVGSIVLAAVLCYVAYTGARAR
jgi:succinate dehydrogenase / fumarate reductase cytochrome b subunit